MTLVFADLGVTFTFSGGLTEAHLVALANSPRITVLFAASHKDTPPPDIDRPSCAISFTNMCEPDVVHTAWRQSAPVHFAACCNNVDFLQFLSGLPMHRVLLRQRASDSRAPLEFAARGGSVDAINFLLKHVPEDLFHANAKSGTALYGAAYFGHVEAVRSLLVAGAHDVDDQCETALSTTCVSGRFTLARLLLDASAANAFVAPQHLDDLPPLYFAAERGNVALVQELLAIGAETKPTNFVRACEMALMLSASLGHSAVVAALIAAGTNPDSDPHRSGTPLFHAVSDLHLETAEILLRAGACPDGSRATDPLATCMPLIAAVNKNSPDAVRLLCQHGADANTRARFAGLALREAAAAGYAEVAEILIDAGADLEATDGSPKPAASSPLALAWERGLAGVVELLLRKGANPESVLGQPAAQLAQPIRRLASNEAPAIFDCLRALARVRPVEARSKLGFLLRVAVRGGYEAVAERLIVGDGADFAAPIDEVAPRDGLVTVTCDQPCSTAIDLACNGGHVDLVRTMLRVHPALFEAILQAAAKSARVDVLEALLREQADRVAAVSSAVRQSLIATVARGRRKFAQVSFVADERNRPRCIEILAAANFPVTADALYAAVDQDKRYAVVNRAVSVVRTLLDLARDPKADIVNVVHPENGFTPLARAHFRGSSTDVIALLKERGANESLLPPGFTSVRRVQEVGDQASAIYGLLREERRKRILAADPVHAHIAHQIDYFDDDDDDEEAERRVLPSHSHQQ